MKWFFIMMAVIMLGSFIALSFETHSKEKTKQLEIQLKIEMVKAGVTNNIH